MKYELRINTGKVRQGKKVYNELGEIDSFKLITIGEKIEYEKKAYIVNNIIQTEDNIKIAEVAEVDKKAEDNVERMPRKDRYGHDVVKVKDGWETRDASGKVIRKLDEDENVKEGWPPYPKVFKEGI